MYKMTVKLISVFLFASTLAGCAHTSVTGHKLVHIDEPVKKLSYVIYSGNFTGRSVGSALINDTANELMPLLPKRIAEVFSLNGIDTAPSGAARHELFIVPFSGIYQPYGGHVGIDMHVDLLERTLPMRTIWKGTLRFWRPGFSSVNEAAADDYAKSILAQLAHDGVVKLESSEIRLPVKKSQ